ncbi:MAG: NAD(P)H-hydrate dehydratase [Planctomycetota bacterium]|nr:MAG: NAD(P)H-hydrate dehydratase [Planctomycetota bacterium]
MELIERIPSLPPLKKDIHKGTAGRILLIGGSQGLSGSIIMATKASLRSGGGLVTVAIPQEISTIVESSSLESMTIYCESHFGHLTEEAWNSIEPAIKISHSVVIGPGIGKHRGIQLLLENILSTDIPTIIDADGLHHFKGHEVDQNRKSPLVITPHIGEMAIITGQPMPTDHQERINIASQFAKEQNVIVVLKSHRTFVTDSINLYEEKGGNPGMATGGTGDILSGTIGTFLNLTDQSTFINVCRAVKLHSLAGDLAKSKGHERSLIATDLINHYPEALHKL